MCVKICRFLVCLSLGLFSSATGISAGQEGGQTVVLIGARLIDGTGQAPQENAALVIQEEMLSAVGPADSVKFPNDTAVIDCHGQTIIPGLISDHSHVG
jgi:imidazolonepropionase-like amidohydrolase